LHSKGSIGFGACELQERLLKDLVQALSEALPAARHAHEACIKAERGYRRVAAVLVELRHSFKSSDGASPDLQGRSAAYRRAVRWAYAAAGADVRNAVEKRFTAGVAYWVRKLLIERYGEDALREMGVLRPLSMVVASADPFVESGRHAANCLSIAVELLNRVASAPGFVPDTDSLRSAARAIRLLQQRLTPDLGRRNDAVA
jgi:hypothetical protein